MGGEALEGGGTVLEVDGGDADGGTADEGGVDGAASGSSVDMTAIAGFRDSDVVTMIRERVLQQPMPAGVYAQLKPLLLSDDMAPAKVATCSAACGAVAAWLQAVLAFADAAAASGISDATIQGWRDMGAKGMQESSRLAAAQKALHAKAEATVGGVREAWGEGIDEIGVVEASVKLTLSIARTVEVPALRLSIGMPCTAADVQPPIPSVESCTDPLASHSPLGELA